jgi:2'-5' RNA ligase
LRTFIAIELSDAVRETLIGFQREIRRFHAPVRWVRAEGMHLTLKFLGEVSADRIAAIRSVLDDVSALHPSFLLEFSGTGTFPAGTRRAPRVIWAGISRNRHLEALHTDLEASLEEIGYPRERRRFHPHLTLGRIKASHGLEAALEFLKRKKEAEFGTMRAGSIVLFESVLRPTGAEYSRIHTADLS